MTPPVPSVLYEDNHLLVVNKPVGLATQGALPGEKSVVTWARDYLKAKYHKPGNVYVGVVSRLDAMVSGALVLARTSKAAARLTEQFRESRVDKLYWAIVPAALDQAAGELVDWVVKDEAAKRTRVCPPHSPGAAAARLEYRTLESLATGVLLEVKLLTGRKHQIRVQFAARGQPIIGDRKYGSRASFPAGIALHARQLTVEHPTLKTPVSVVAPLPKAWGGMGVSGES